MDDNIYDEIMNGMDKLPDESKKAFFQEFWGTMSREEKLVFTIDAMDSFKRSGILNEFIKDVNANIGSKQDHLMDAYIDGVMTKEEFIKAMSGAKKIETKSNSKK